MPTSTNLLAVAENSIVAVALFDIVNATAESSQQNISSCSDFSPFAQAFVAGSRWAAKGSLQVCLPPERSDGTSCL
jgi:hypothetical protein